MNTRSRSGPPAYKEIMQKKRGRRVIESSEDSFEDEDNNEKTVMPHSEDDYQLS